MIQFIHAADLHLDSPLRGLDRYEGAPVDQLRGATRRAFEALVTLALETHVAFVLLAGDIYDADWRDFNTGLFFARQLHRLREANIPVFLVKGNHDAQSRISRQLRLPEGVVTFSADAPQTHRLEHLGIALHGQSFATGAVPDNLAAAYPDALPGWVNIGILHTCLEGQEGHEPYAPTTVAQLTSKGYDYWALGHIHRRQEVSRDPWIVFSGNLQGRHIRETGPKGCTLVTIEDARVTRVEAKVLDVVRWVHLHIPGASASTPSDLVDQVQVQLEQAVAEAGERLVAARVALEGPSAAHEGLMADPERWRNELRLVASTALGERIWLEKIHFRTRPEADLEAMMGRGDALGGLLETIHNLDTDQVCLEELGTLFKDLQRKLPVQLRTGPDALDLADETTLRVALTDVKQLLLTRLLGQGSPTYDSHESPRRVIPTNRRGV